MEQRPANCPVAQVLELLLGAVSVKPGQFAAQRAANCTAVAMAALAGLVPLARRSRSEGGAADKVAVKVLQLASCMLEDQVSCTGDQVPPSAALATVPSLAPPPLASAMPLADPYYHFGRRGSDFNGLAVVGGLVVISLSLQWWPRARLPVIMEWAGVLCVLISLTKLRVICPPRALVYSIVGCMSWLGEHHSVHHPGPWAQAC